MVNPLTAPGNVDKDEWRRAVALLAATETHSDATTLSPTIRETNVVLSAKRFERFLRDGT